ncbi:MAG: tRNA (N(6)-L-threonylcarbamoyladenosine(37)-C(2))-methylthiotransferase MtaB [Lachnospiraceae bacterium]|nr:tRNA (N(6)-L-threonylcarbamoyladenosine(37)-C(2))-methylthiotransferase MtaB [Lachnospiraceae bacterium]
MQKVAFHNLGCKVNAYEMELMQQNFADSGYEIVPFSEKADIYIVNTCTVTNIADRKSRQMLHRAKTLSPEAVVVAAGCYVETDMEGALKDKSIDLIVGNKDKKDIVRLVEEYMSESKGSAEPEEVSDVPPKDQAAYRSTVCRPLTHLTDHTRAYIKIQDGCDQYCSYCIIPYSRGHVVSRDEDETVSEIRGLVEEGCREFVITGINLSSYGLDRPYNMAAKDGKYNNEALIDVIRKSAAIEGVQRIRLGSLEPRIITHDFLSAMSETEAFCPHFHLSLQSGSNEVLKRMNRRYDVDEYYEKVQLIRKYFEHPAITTDVIVGFPGETEEEFDETRSFLDKVNFYETHVFAYSRRRGTVADRMPGQLTQKQKSVRSAILMEDSSRRAKSFREYYKDSPAEVLIEEEAVVEGTPYLVGYNKEYVRFAVDKGDDDAKDMTGKIISCRALDFIGDELLHAVSEGS